MRGFQRQICKTFVSTRSTENQGATYEKPYVTQFDSEKPAMFIIISMTISLPRQLALDVSPCHTGAKIVSPIRLDTEIRFTS